MADVRIPSNLQARFRGRGKDTDGNDSPLDGRVQLVNVDPANIDPITGLPVEIPFPDGWTLGPDQPSMNEVVLLPPLTGATPDDITKCNVMLKGDADLTTTGVIVLLSRVWAITDIPPQAVVLEGEFITLEARGT